MRGWAASPACRLLLLLLQRPQRLLKALIADLYIHLQRHKLTADDLQGFGRHPANLDGQG